MNPSGKPGGVGSWEESFPTARTTAELSRFLYGPHQSGSTTLPFVQIDSKWIWFASNNFRRHVSVSARIYHPDHLYLITEYLVCAEVWNLYEWTEYVIFDGLRSGCFSLIWLVHQSCSTWIEWLFRTSVDQCHSFEPSQQCIDVIVFLVDFNTRPRLSSTSKIWPDTSQANSANKPLDTPLDTRTNIPSGAISNQRTAKMSADQQLVSFSTVVKLPTETPENLETINLLSTGYYRMLD